MKSFFRWIHIGLKMMNKFDLLSDLKIIYWFFCRKIVKSDNKNLVGKVYVKKIHNNVWIRPYCSDFTLLLDFFVKESHGKGGHYEFSQITDDVNYIIDGGANIGFFSVLYATKYPKATIVAVEPEDSNFRMLKRNCKSYQNIILVHAGIWKRDTKLKIINPNYHSVGFIVKEIETSDDNDFLKGISIKKIIDTYSISKIDILKLDIEGSEFQVFGIETCDDWLSKVRYLIMEIHDVYLESGREIIYEKMREYGFQHYRNAEDDFFYKL